MHSSGPDKPENVLVAAGGGGGSAGTYGNPNTPGNGGGENGGHATSTSQIGECGRGGSQTAGGAEGTSQHSGNGKGKFFHGEHNNEQMPRWLPSPGPSSAWSGWLVGACGCSISGPRYDMTYQQGDKGTGRNLMLALAGAVGDSTVAAGVPPDLVLVAAVQGTSTRNHPPKSPLSPVRPKGRTLPVRKTNNTPHPNIVYSGACI